MIHTYKSIKRLVPGATGFLYTSVPFPMLLECLEDAVNGDEWKLDEPGRAWEDSTGTPEAAGGGKLASAYPSPAPAFTCSP